MPPTALNIKSSVIDVRIDTPQETDTFFIDTNVWYWLTYTKISNPALRCRPYQTINYPAYTTNALGTNCKIFCSGLNISELVHLVENSEYQIFEKSNSGISKKSFRHGYNAERINVCSEVKIACDQVLQFSEQIPINITDIESKGLVDEFPNYKLDGYDLLNLQAMQSTGITQIITDDGDFTSVPGITVFTANQNVIDQAKTQGKLLTR